MGSIFVSYRREDAEGQAGRLYDDLVTEFGSGSVFMDVAALQPGRDFRKAIDQSLTSCGVFLSLIGKNWLTAKDPSGQRRLDDAADFVRIETAAALKRDIPVIPVLVQGASVPKADQLPVDLQDLAYRNAIELTHPRWDSDMQVLIKSLRPHVSPRREAKGNSAKFVGVAAAVLLIVSMAFYLWTGRKTATPPASESAQTASAPPDTEPDAKLAASDRPKPKPTNATVSQPKADRKVPSLEDFSLSATQEPLANNPNRYTFTLSLRGPNEAIKDISRVHYDFVYAPNPLSIEGGSAPAFSVAYEGWGCYQTVDVTVYFKSPGMAPQKKTFNMCNVLSHNALSP